MNTSTATKKVRTIGILGGMGPVSSANFYSDILRCCQTEFHAAQDEDYPPMLLYSLPLRGWDTTGFRDVPVVLAQILPALRVLEKGGADFIVIPCNTCHFLIPEMRAAVSIPVLSMIDLVVQEAQRKGFRHVGLLSTESTSRLGIYQQSARAVGVGVVNASPKQQDVVTRVIGNVEAGNNTDKDAHELEAIAAEMRKGGADAVILGCTELPVAMRNATTEIPLLDSACILATAAARYAYGKE